MEMHIEKSSMVSALKLIAHIQDETNVRPVSVTRLDSDQAEMAFLSASSGVYFRLQADFTNWPEGESVLLPRKQALSFVKASEDADISLRGEQDTIRLLMGRSRLSVQMISAETFPHMILNGEKFGWLMSPVELTSALEFIKSAFPKDTEQKMPVYLEAREDGAHIYTTDGKVLFHGIAAIQGEMPENPLLLPQANAFFLLSMLKGIREDIRVEAGDNMMSFATEEVTYYTSYIAEGKKIPWEKFLSASTEEVCSLGSGGLAAAAEMGAAMDAKASALDVGVGANEIRCSTRHLNGESMGGADARVYQDARFMVNAQAFTGHAKATSKLAGQEAQVNVSLVHGASAQPIRLDADIAGRPTLIMAPYNQ